MNPVINCFVEGLVQRAIGFEGNERSRLHSIVGKTRHHRRHPVADHLGDSFEISQTDFALPFEEL